MNKAISYTYIILLAIMAFSCSFGPKQPRTFYNTIAGWDISYIPIIKPYRAVSVDRGSSWSIEIPETLENIDVISFAVTRSFIYGKEKPSWAMLDTTTTGKVKPTWFLLDTKTKLYARYETEEELVSTLNTFDIPVKAIAKCNTYFDSLADDNKLYWFPSDGKTYPDYPGLTPDAVTTISVKEDDQQLPDLFFKDELAFKKSKVYFFNVRYNKKTNDLYYLSVNNNPPVLVKDSLLMPVFINTDSASLTLYTPFPVAQQKGISEARRFYKNITISIADRKNKAQIIKKELENE